MSQIEYRPILAGDYEAVRQFLAGLGWERRVTDPDRFAKMMARADRTVLALDGGRVVGCVRALCDGVSNGYISMLAVAEDRSDVWRHEVRDVSGRRQPVVQARRPDA